MSGISLNLNNVMETGRRTRRYQKQLFWVHLANMQNNQVALQVKGDKIKRIICRDKAVYEAVATLKHAKALFTEHGASEGLMAVFNNGNQLSDAIGIEIPRITSINYQSVGRMCCEGIDAAVDSACGKVCEFFDELAKTVADYVAKLVETSNQQRETLAGLTSDVLGNIETIDAEAFGTDEVFGFTQPVFVERIQALNTINDALPSLTPERLAAIEPALKSLGYQVEAPAEAEAAPEVVETPEEVAQAEAPAPAEVMSAPVAEAPAQEDLAPEEQREAEVPVAADTPADAPQQQEIAVFRWTPANLRDAINDLSTVLGKASNLGAANQLIANIKSDVCGRLDQAGNMAEDAKASADADIDAARKFAASVGNIVQLYGAACNALVDQVVAMCGKLKSAEVPAAAPEAVPVETVTEQQPLGNKRRSRLKKRGRSRNCNSLLWDEGETGEDTDPAGALEEGTEGPVEGEPAPSASDRRRSRRKGRNRNFSLFDEYEGGDVTEHEFDPEKQMDDPAGTLPDESEGEGKGDPAPSSNRRGGFWDGIFFDEKDDDKEDDDDDDKSSKGDDDEPVDDEPADDDDDKPSKKSDDDDDDDKGDDDDDDDKGDDDDDEEKKSEDRRRGRRRGRSRNCNSLYWDEEEAPADDQPVEEEPLVEPNEGGDEEGDEEEPPAEERRRGRRKSRTRNTMFFWDEKDDDKGDDDDDDKGSDDDDSSDDDSSDDEESSEDRRRGRRRGRTKNSLWFLDEEDGKDLAEETDGDNKGDDFAEASDGSNPDDGFAEASDNDTNQDRRRARRRGRNRNYRFFDDEFEGGDVTEHEFEPDKQMDDPAGTLPDDAEGEGKGDPAPSSNRRRRRSRSRNDEEPVSPDGVVEEPLVEPGAPAEPEVAPVSPDGEPVEEQPLVPPQPAMTNEGGVEEPDGLPDGSGAPEPLDEPADGVDPNGDPDVPDAVTEPYREPVETPPEDIPGESAEKKLNADQLFRWL